MGHVLLLSRSATSGRDFLEAVLRLWLRLVSAAAGTGANNTVRRGHAATAGLRALKRPTSILGAPPVARSASISPRSGPNLKPCPVVPAPMTTRPTRSTTKSPSAVES